MSAIEVKVKRLAPVPLPRYATPGSAGLDLVAALPAPLDLAPGQRARIPTGLALQMPEGWAGLVMARSGLAWRHGLALANGVGLIDADYTGEVQVLLVNAGSEPVRIQPGDRIAQLVLVPVGIARLVPVDELAPTARGEGGFGSTGL